MSIKKSTQNFYDEYWPQNVPDYTKTREHVLSIVPYRNFLRILDAGCGTGVCSLALSDVGKTVVSFDISRGSIGTAEMLSKKLNKTNITFTQGNLLELPFKNNSFDLVFSWGVIHHTPNPEKALEELVRVLSVNGILVLAVYRKTELTFLHEIIRKICLKLPKSLKLVVIKSVAGFVGLIGRIKTLNEVRKDNITIEAKIEDWYFVPEKHFFYIDEMKDLFRKHNMEFELLHEATGRFKSTSNFIVRGKKRGEVDARRN